MKTFLVICMLLGKRQGSVLQSLFSWHLRGAPAVVQVLRLDSSVPKIRGLGSQHSELEVTYISSGKYLDEASFHFFQELSCLPLVYWEANHLSLMRVRFNVF